MNSMCSNNINLVGICGLSQGVYFLNKLFIIIRSKFMVR